MRGDISPLGKLNGDDLVSEVWDNKSLEFLNDEQGSPYGFIYRTSTSDSGTPYYYIKNLQGDVIFIVDGLMNIVARYTYDAWGNHLFITDGS